MSLAVQFPEIVGSHIVDQNSFFFLFALSCDLRKLLLLLLLLAIITTFITYSNISL